MAKFILLLLIFILNCYLANAQKPKDEIEVRVNSDLSFGSFVISGTGGTVTISPDGNRTVTGTVIGLANLPFSSAEFEITTKGRPDIRFDFFEPAYLYGPAGSQPIEVTNFTSNKPNNSFQSTGGNHPDFVRVGATLSVINSQSHPAGVYSGEFTVTFIQE